MGDEGSGKRQEQKSQLQSAKTDVVQKDASAQTPNLAGTVVGKRGLLGHAEDLKTGREKSQTTHQLHSSGPQYESWEDEDPTQCVQIKKPKLPLSTKKDRDARNKDLGSRSAKANGTATTLAKTDVGRLTDVTAAGVAAAVFGKRGLKEHP